LSEHTNTTPTQQYYRQLDGSRQKYREKKEKWTAKRRKQKKDGTEEDTWTIGTNLDEKLVDIEQSYRWLKSGDFKGETESTIVVAQSKEISRECFKNKILKKEIESKCRLCKQHEENIDHLTSGCQFWQRTNI